MPSSVCLEADIQLTNGMQALLDLREEVLLSLQTVSDYDTAQEDAVNRLADAGVGRNKRAVKKLLEEIDRRYEKRYQLLLDIERKCNVSLGILDEMSAANKRVNKLCPKEMRTLTEESLDIKVRDARVLRNKVRFKAAEAKRLRDGGERGRTWFEWAMDTMQGKPKAMEIAVQTSPQISANFLPQKTLPSSKTSNVPARKTTINLSMASNKKDQDCVGKDAWHRFCARERSKAAREGNKLTQKELGFRYRQASCVGRQQPNYADYSKFKAIALELWVLKFDESAWIRASHGPEAAMQLMLQALLDDIFSPGAMYIYTYLIPNNKTLKEALEENPRRSHIAPPVLYGQRASPMKLTGGPAATLIGSRNPPENVHAKLRVFRSPDSEWQPDTSDCVPVQDDTGEPVEINNDGSEVDAARNSVSSFSPKSSADWTLSLPLASGEQNGVGRSSSLGQTLRHRFHERTSSILLQIEQGSKGAGSDMPDLEALVDKYIEEEAEFQEPASGDEGVHISAPPLVVRALAAALQRKRAILVTHAGDGPWITEHITRNLRGRCTNVVSSEAAAMGAQRLMPLQRFLTQVRAGQLAPASIVVQDAHLLRLDQTALDTQQALQTFFSRCPRVYLVTDAPMQSAAADMYELTRFVKGSRYVNKSFDEDVSGAETVDEVALASLVGTSTLASRSVYSIWRMSNFLGKPTVQERLVKEAQTQRVTFLEHLASHARANVAKLSMALNSDFDKKGVAQNLYKVASVVDQGNLNNFASIGHLENVRLAGEAASRRVESANEEWGEAKKFAALAMVMVAVTLVSFQISRLMRRSEEDVKAVLHECRAWVIAVPRAMPALRQLHIESKSVDMTWPQIKLWMDMMMDSAAGRSTPLTDLQSSIDMQHVSHMAVREDGTENVSTDAPKVHDLARALMTFVAESESKRALVISKFHKEGTERVKYALASLAAHVSQKDAADRITLVSLEDTVVEAGVLQRISEAVDGRDAEVHFLEPLGSHPAFARIVHMLESTRGDADVPMRVVQWQSASSHLKGALHTSASALQWMTDKIKWKYTLVPFWLRRGSDVSPDSMLSQEQDRMGRLYDFVRAELAVSSVSKCCIRQEDVQGQEFCANEAGKRDAPPCVVDAVVGGASGGQAVAPLAMLATVLVSVASSMG